MGKMKIIDEIADAQAHHIKETLYESVEWGMDGVEEFENLNSENYNQVHSAIMIATIEKLHLELDTLFSVNDKEPFLPATKSVNDE